MLYNSTTVHALIDWIRNEVITRGEVCYDDNDVMTHGCSYKEGHCSDVSPGCIVGQGLRAIGAEAPQEDRGISTLCDQEVELGNTKWLQRVQGMQDDGVVWSKCVEHADGMQMIETIEHLTAKEKESTLSE